MLPVFVICCLTTSACHMGYALSMNLKLTTAKGFCFAYSCFVYMNCLFIYLFFLFNCKYLTISGQGWAKYSNLSVASRSIICQSRRLKQIIDLRDTDKSRYFVITKFNNCFIIRSLSLFFFNEYPFHLPFSCKSDCKKEKSTVSFSHEQNIICSQIQLDSIVHEQTIICRQLFAGHVVGCRPMKREKNLLRMIIDFIAVHIYLYTS